MFLQRVVFKNIKKPMRSENIKIVVISLYVNLKYLISTKRKFIDVDIKFIYLNSLRRQSCAFAGGKAPVTKVTKEIFSHFKISQQFFNALTELSRVLMAEEERAYLPKIKILVLSYFTFMYLVISLV